MRVVALMSRHSPKMAQSRIESQERACTSDTGFFRGGSDGKVVAPVVVPSWQKTVVPKQIIDFWPQISNFWIKIALFFGLGGPYSIFSTQKKYLIGSPIWGYQKFWPKNGQIWLILGIFGHFWLNIGLSGPFDDIRYQNTMWTRCLGGNLCGYQRFWSHPPKNRINGPKTAILAPK